MLQADTPHSPGRNVCQCSSSQAQHRLEHGDGWRPKSNSATSCLLWAQWRRDPWHTGSIKPEPSLVLQPRTHAVPRSRLPSPALELRGDIVEEGLGFVIVAVGAQEVFLSRRLLSLGHHSRVLVIPLLRVVVYQGEWSHELCSAGMAGLQGRSWQQPGCPIPPPVARHSSPFQSSSP